jgi:hypothetical protein
MLLRKSAVVALCLALGAGSASAQFTVGTLDIGPTIGLGGLGSGAGINIGGRIEKGFKELPSLGNGILGIDAFVQRWSFDPCGGSFNDCGASILFFGARVNYHFKLSSMPKLDPFIGLGLGYATWSWDGDTFDTFDDSGIDFVGNAGIRYYFSPKMAGYADVGTGAATLNLGIMFKLKG